MHKLISFFLVLVCTTSFIGCKKKDSNDVVQSELRLSVLAVYETNKFTSPSIDPVHSLTISIDLFEDSLVDGVIERTRVDVNTTNQFILKIDDAEYDLSEHKSVDLIIGTINYDMSFPNPNLEPKQVNIFFKGNENLSASFEIPALLSVETNVKLDYSPTHDDLIIDWNIYGIDRLQVLQHTQDECADYDISVANVLTHIITAGTICPITSSAVIMLKSNYPHNLELDVINENFNSYSVKFGQHFTQRVSINAED